MMGVPGLSLPSLSGYSYPTRRTARISCFVLRSYRWPPPSLSKWVPSSVSATNFLLKAYLGKPRLGRIAHFPPPPITAAKGFCIYYPIASSAPHIIREARQICFPILWIRGQTQHLRARVGSSGGLEPRSRDVRGNAIFLTQCLLLLRPHQSEVTSSLLRL